jgi:PII-like signaling protein
VVSVAIDTRARIENVLEEAISIKRHGLIPLERASMLTGEVGPVALPEERHEATKLTIYAGRGERVSGVPAFIAVCEPLHRARDRRRDGAPRRRWHRSWGASARALLRTRCRDPDDDHRLGAGDQIARLLPELRGMVRRTTTHARARPRLQPRWPVAGKVHPLHLH